MAVDDQGGKFRQYDLTVDGLSYFSMPAVFELGTDRMWSKVSRWGLMRAESQEEEISNGGGMHGEHKHVGNNREFESKGRMVDEYYFDKAKGRSSAESYRYGQSISKSEHKALNPRSESDEERMVRIATEASLQDWEKDHGHGKTHGSSRSRSSEENDSSFGNGRKDSSRRAKKENSTNKLGAIGEDNLIDFGSDASKAMSQITISRQTTSDISVMDDDATTASFMENTAWNSSGAQPPPPPQHQPPRQPHVGQLYPDQQQQQQQPPYYQELYPNQQQQQQQPQYYQDPTFRSQYAQQPWTSVGTISSNPVTPRGSVGIPSDASFAVPPPPTMDDYNNAFGGSTMNMGASVIGGSTVMTHSQPMSPGASVGMTSPMAQMQPQMAQYGMQQASQWQSQSFGPPGGGPVVGGMSMSMGASPQMAKSNKFDPMRADPFAS